jgi:hypothetical protein
MERLFPPWANTALWTVLATFGLLLVSGPLLAMVIVRTPWLTATNQPVDQPLLFDHRHHVRDGGVDCLVCHAWAADDAVAGLPPTELCMGCHNQIWNESPLLEPVRRSFLEDRPISWRRVHDLPDFVFFHHGAHVSRGVGCATCHGRVDELAQVYPVAPLRMAWCLECHRDPAPHLRPRAQVTDMAYRTSREEGLRLQRDQEIAPPLHCTGCHR